MRLGQRLGRQHSFGAKDEIAGQGRGVPRGLQPPGFLQHQDAHIFEHLFDRLAGDQHLCGQRHGERAVSAQAVQRHGPGSGGERQKRAGGRVHFGQTIVVQVRNLHKRIVPAGIQDHDIGPVAGRKHLAQHGIRFDPYQTQVGGIAQCGINGQQIVAPETLNPMSGIIKQSRRIRPAVAQGRTKGRNGGAHVVQIAVRHQSHRKADIGQGLRHQCCIIDRVGQGRDDGIIAVADDQRDPRLGQCLSGRPKPKTKDDQDRTHGETLLRGPCARVRHSSQSVGQFQRHRNPAWHDQGGGGAEMRRMLHSVLER